MLAGTTTIIRCAHEQRALPVVDVSVLFILVVDRGTLPEPVLFMRREERDVQGIAEAGQVFLTKLQRLTLLSVNNAAKHVTECILTKNSPFCFHLTCCNCFLSISSSSKNDYSYDTKQNFDQEKKEWKEKNCEDFGKDGCLRLAPPTALCSDQLPVYTGTLCPVLVFGPADIGRTPTHHAEAIRRTCKLLTQPEQGYAHSGLHLIVSLPD